MGGLLLIRRRRQPASIDARCSSTGALENRQRRHPRGGQLGEPRRLLSARSLAVLAPWPAAGPALAILQLLLGSANAAFSCRLLFGILDPADELVAGERGDVRPSVECRWIGHQRRAQVSWKLVHDPAGHSRAAHRATVAASKLDPDVLLLPLALRGRVAERRGMPACPSVRLQADPVAVFGPPASGVDAGRGHRAAHPEAAHWVDPSILEPRRRIRHALYAVVIGTYVNRVSTRSIVAETCLLAPAHRKHNESRPVVPPLAVADAAVRVCRALPSRTSLSPVCSDHGLVEERHREGGVAVCRAVDHPFGNEPGAARCDRFDSNSELRCDVARSVRSRAEIGHRPQILLLLWRQTVEPDEKEVPVKLVDDTGSSGPDVGFRDWTSLSVIPHVIAPLLEEVGIAAGLSDDEVNRCGCELDPERTRRDRQRRRCIDGGQ